MSWNMHNGNNATAKRKRGLAKAIQDAAKQDRDVTKKVLDQIREHPEVILGSMPVLLGTNAPVVPAVVVAEPPLTKEQAMADTMRALKECYPDRWERVWAALGKESASDVAVAQVGKAVAKNPAAAMGALLGGLLGAAIGRRTP